MLLVMARLLLLGLGMHYVLSDLREMNRGMRQWVGLRLSEHPAVYRLDAKAALASRPAVCSGSGDQSDARAVLYTTAVLPRGFKHTSPYPFRNLGACAC